mgnify:CR=1 FL=1
MFTGTVRVKICEACGLKPTDFQKRHNMAFSKPDEQSIDPYVTIDVDDNHLDRSSTKSKTSDPVWNEHFVHNVQSAVNLGLTVFHDAAIPPDDFVANCNISFEDLLQRDREAGEFWVKFILHFYNIQPFISTYHKYLYLHLIIFINLMFNIKIIYILKVCCV